MTQRDHQGLMLMIAVITTLISAGCSDSPSHSPSNSSRQASDAGNSQPAQVSGDETSASIDGESVSPETLSSEWMDRDPSSESTPASEVRLTSGTAMSTADDETGVQYDSGLDTDAEADSEEERPKVADRSSSAASLAKGEINFDDLKFDIEKDAAFASEKLNEDVKKLDGRQVKLRGYILPSTVYQEFGIERFVLVRDNQECCFGPGAALFDCVCVEMVPGNTTNFSTLPVTVKGKFEIDTEAYRYPEGAGPKGATHYSIFRIRAKNVE